MKSKPPTYEQSSRFDSIVNVLLSFRLSSMRKRRKASLYHELFHAAQSPVALHPSVVDHLLPPRSTWIRLKKDQRKHLTSLEIRRKEIRITLLNAYSKNTTDLAGWQIRLNAFVEEIQAIMRGEVPFYFKQPKINAIPKHSGGVRLVCSYGLQDRVILSLLARYLTAHLDDLFLPCSYAFRREYTKTHHEAVRDLLAYKNRHPPESLHIAECDIAQFFDTVDHRVALQAYHDAVEALQSRGVDIHPCATQLFTMAIESYSFSRDIAGADTDANHPWSPSVEKWKEIISPLYDDYRNHSIGIAQGSPLSGLIANLILHQADQLMMATDDPSLFYARFVDDMLIAHPDPEACRRHFEQYIEILKSLRLPTHPPQSVKYGSEYYEHKSKSPFAWTACNVPWIGFVGYQIRYDGLLRIRKESLTKERKNLQKVTDHVLHCLNQPNAMKKDPLLTILTIEKHMIGHAVGRVDLQKEQHLPSQLCWAAGFQVLHVHPHESQPLRVNDHLRERHLNTLWKAMTDKTPRSGTTRPKATTGAVRSYYGAFSGTPYNYDYPIASGKGSY